MSEPKNVWITAFAIDSGAFIFILGFIMGYSEEPDCETALTQKVLNDPIFREGVIARKMADYVPLKP